MGRRACLVRRQFLGLNEANGGRSRSLPSSSRQWALTNDRPCHLVALLQGCETSYGKVVRKRLADAGKIPESSMHPSDAAGGVGGLGGLGGPGGLGDRGRVSRGRRDQTDSCSCVGGTSGGLGRPSCRAGRLRCILRAADCGLQTAVNGAPGQAKGS